MEFLLQPNVYSTGVRSNLLNMPDRMWHRDHVLGIDAYTIFLASPTTLAVSDSTHPLLTTPARAAEYSRCWWKHQPTVKRHSDSRSTSQPRCRTMFCYVGLFSVSQDSPNGSKKD